MPSILILLGIICVLFLIGKKMPPSPWIKTCQLISINALILETGCYLILLFLAFHIDNFYLIGNQSNLDKIIKSKLTDELFPADRLGGYQMYRLDPVLGYTKAKKDILPTQLKEVNNQGFRAPHNYPLLPREDALRVVALGDSFVHCDGEPIQNCWTNMLEENLGGLEIINLGVGGYGLGQSYLRFLNDGLSFSPDLVLINYIHTGDRDTYSINNILQGTPLNHMDPYKVLFWQDENHNIFSMAMDPYYLFSRSFRSVMYQLAGFNYEKTFWSSWFFSKTNTGLIIKQSFLKKHIPFKNMDKTTTPGGSLNVKIIQDFCQLAQRHSFKIIFLVNEPVSDNIKAILAQYENDAFVISPQPFFNAVVKQKGLAQTSLLNKTNHYNAAGNLIYAAAVKQILVSKPWQNTSRSFKFDANNNKFIRVK